MAINHTEEISFCGQNRNWFGSSLLRNVLQMYSASGYWDSLTIGFLEIKQINN